MALILRVDLGFGQFQGTGDKLQRSELQTSVLSL